MKITKNLVPESNYKNKCPYEMKPTRIVVHNTANDASAANEIAAALGAEPVQAIGSKFVLYKQAKNVKNRKIELPRK